MNVNYYLFQPQSSDMDITKISQKHFEHFARFLFRINIKKVLVCFILFSYTLPIFSQKHTSQKKRIYVMKKGRHHATNLLKNRLLRRVEHLDWYSCFDTSARYIIGTENGSIHEDQHDWSKLSGITFTPWQPRKNTAMAGWRYNNVIDSIELTPYFHVNGVRIFNDDPHLTIGVDEPFEHEIQLNYETKDITLTIKTARGVLSETHTFTTFRNWLVLIHPYFGGNKRAPRRIKLKVHLKVKKRINSKITN